MDLSHSTDTEAVAPAARKAQTVLLLNANAGGGRAASYKRRIEAHIARLPQRPMLFVSQDAQTANRLVDALPSGSRVIVFGGDGSVSAMLPSLVAGGHTLGLVPIGSGNDTARALGISGMKWDQALDHALLARPTMVDLGELAYTNARGFEQRRLFISSFNAGFDAAVVQHALALPGWLTGMPRYTLATLAELSALRSFDLAISIDGRAIHAGPVLLASTLNTSTYGGGMQIAPTATMDDGALDLLMASEMGLMRVLTLLPRMLMGRHLGEPGVVHQCIGQLTLSATAPVPVAADGEYLGEAIAASVQVRPALLPVLKA